MNHTHRTPPSPCPNCGAKLDAATNMPWENNAPGPGDPGVCLQCGTVLAYTDKLTVRRATKEDFDGWPQEVRLQVLKVIVARKFVVPRDAATQPGSRH